MNINQWRYPQPFIRFGVKVVVSPFAEQITLQDAYDHLRLDPYGSPPTHPDDNLLSANITAAREWCQGYSGRSFAPQTLEMGMANFPNQLPFGPFGFGGGGRGYIGFGYGSFNDDTQWIKLPAGPVRGVESVRYTDANGDWQTFDPVNYTLDNFAEPARIYLMPNLSWPETLRIPNAVRIRYAAGYSLPGDSPQEFQISKLALQAMKLLLGHFYENRENVFVNDARAVALELPQGAASLLDLDDPLDLGMA